MERLEHAKWGTLRTYTVFLFIEHEGGYGPTSVHMIAGLTMDTDSGMANAEMIDSARDSTGRRRHLMEVM